jgi:cysteine dioxygenase
MKPMSLSELAHLVGGVPARPGPPELEALGRRWPAGLDAPALCGLAEFSDRGYARRCLYRTPAWELLVVGWLPGQRTPVHGHCDSWGVTCVLEGVLEEVCYAGCSGLGATGRRRAAAGDVFHETPQTIHHVENAGGARAVSLHLYAPPLTCMEGYRVKPGPAIPLDPDAATRTDP